MSSPGEIRWKQMVARLAQRVGVSPHDVELATDGRIQADELSDLLGAGIEFEKEGSTMVATERTQAANAYMKQKMLFTPRMFQIINTVAPEAGERFADFYESIWADGALPRKVKELMFTAIGVSYRSPACLIHVVPAIEAGATDGEIFEAVAIGTLAAGFVPGGPGIPYAFQYATKVLEIAAKYRAGEPWEYVQPAEFRM